MYEYLHLFFFGLIAVHSLVMFLSQCILVDDDMAIIVACAPMLGVLSFRMPLFVMVGNLFDCRPRDFEKTSVTFERSMRLE